jgi:hypothetical protein
MAVYFFSLITFYIFPIVMLAYLPVAEYPCLACSAFFLSHIALYFLITNKRSQQFELKWMNFKNILLLAFSLRLLFFLVSPSDDVARYAWEGKMVSQGGNPYLHAPLWFTEYDIKEMSASDKMKLRMLFEKESNPIQIKSNSIISDGEYCLFVNRLLMNNNLTLYLNDKTGLQGENQKWLKDAGNEFIIQNRILLTRLFISLEDKIQSNINHKEMSAIYPPVTLLIFGLLMKISYSFVTFKILFFVCDLITITFICLMLKKLQKPVVWSLFYVMSPLVLLFGIGNCHLDILQNTFLIAGLYCSLFLINRKWIAFGFFLLGCAVLTKYLAIIVLPFILKKNNLSLLVYFLIPFLSFLFFADPKIWASLFVFSSQMHFNDAIPRLLREIGLNGSVWYSLMIVIVYTAGYIAIWLLFQDVPLKGMLYAWVWLIFCLPVVHAWYLIPICLFLCFHMVRSFYFLSLIMGLHFFILAYQYSNNGIWLEFWWVPAITYLGFLILYLVEINFLKAEFFYSNRKNTSLDIVVPIFNEEIKIDSFFSNLLFEVESLNSLKKIKVNIIAVDGSSVDNTVLLLKKHPVQVLVSEKRGRGNQLAMGYKHGNSDLILFLHVDSILKKNSLLNMIEAFERRPECAWGVLGHVYDSNSIKLRFVELLNRFRFFFFGIAFGDQGIFVRRQVLDQVGCPEIPLMEDVEISIRLFRFPNRINLNGQLIGSARRWKKYNFIYSFTQVIYLCLKYLFCRNFGCDIKVLSEKMFKAYYSK